MKEKLLSSLPYLLLALFFVGIFAVNSQTHVAGPTFSLELTGDIPEISTDTGSDIEEIAKNEPEDHWSEAKTENESQIIETKPIETGTETSCFYTKNGNKYHLKEDCRYLKNSATIIKATVEFAKDLGLEPCSGCGD